MTDTRRPIHVDLARSTSSAVRNHDTHRDINFVPLVPRRFMQKARALQRGSDERADIFHCIAIVVNMRTQAEGSHASTRPPAPPGATRHALNKN